MDDRGPDTRYESLIAGKPHEYSQHGSSAVSPWVQTANSDDFRALDFNERPSFEELDTFIDDNEPPQSEMPWITIPRA